MKKIPGILLAISLMTAVGGVTMSALPFARENRVSTNVEGTEVGLTANGENKYIITTAKGLAEMAFYVSAGGDFGTYQSATYELAADIDLSGKIWTPIGTSTKPFTGTFIGNGYEISGMWSLESGLFDSANVGLFGYTDGAKILDVVLAGGATSYTGTNNGNLVGSASNTTFANIYDKTTTGVSTVGKYYIEDDATTLEIQEGPNTYYQGNYIVTKEIVGEEEVLVGHEETAVFTQLLEGVITDITPNGYVASLDTKEGLYYKNTNSEINQSRSKGGIFHNIYQDGIKVISSDIYTATSGTFGYNTPDMAEPSGIVTTDTAFLKKTGNRLKTTPWAPAINTWVGSAPNYSVAQWQTVTYEISVEKQDGTFVTKMASIDSAWSDLIAETAGLETIYDLLTASVGINKYYGVEIRYDVSGSMYLQADTPTPEWTIVSGTTGFVDPAIHSADKLADQSKNYSTTVGYSTAQVFFDYTASEDADITVTGITLGTTWQASKVNVSTILNYTDGRIAGKDVSVTLETTPVNPVFAQGSATNEGNTTTIPMIALADVSFNIGVEVPYGYAVTSVENGGGTDSTRHESNFSISFAGGIRDNRNIIINIERIKKSIQLPVDNKILKEVGIINGEGEFVQDAAETALINNGSYEVSYGDDVVFRFSIAEGSTGYFPDEPSVSGFSYTNEQSPSALSNPLGGTVEAPEYYQTAIMALEGISWVAADSPAITLPVGALSFTLDITKDFPAYESIEVENPIIQLVKDGATSSLNNGENNITLSAEVYELVFNNTDYYEISGVEGQIISAEGKEVAIIKDNNTGKYTFTLPEDVVAAWSWKVVPVTFSFIKPSYVINTEITDEEKGILLGTDLPTVTGPASAHIGDTLNLSFNAVSEFYEFKGWYIKNNTAVLTNPYSYTIVQGDLTPTNEGGKELKIYATFTEKSSSFTLSDTTYVLNKDISNPEFNTYTPSTISAATITGNSDLTLTYGAGLDGAISVSDYTDGYTFKGWYVEIDGTWTQIISADYPTVGTTDYDTFFSGLSAEVFAGLNGKTLIPLFEQKTITLKIDWNDGSENEVETTGITLYYDGSILIYDENSTVQDVIKLPSKARFGYTANGWTKTISSSTIEINKGGFISTSAIFGQSGLFTSEAEGNAVASHLEKVWEANEYTLTFHANFDLETATTTQIFIFDQAQILDANSFTRTGYDFAGWNTAIDGTGVSYNDGATFTLTTDTLTEEEANAGGKSLYAQWTEHVYDITLDQNNEDGLVGVAVTYNATAITGYLKPTRTGLTLVGWYTVDNAGEGVQVINADGNLIAGVAGYTDIDGKWIKTDSQTTTLYARWNNATYIISSGNGASIELELQGNLTVKKTYIPGNTISALATGITETHTFKYSETEDGLYEDLPEGISYVYGDNTLTFTGVKSGYFKVVYTLADVHNATEGSLEFWGSAIQITVNPCPLVLKGTVTEAENIWKARMFSETNLNGFTAISGSEEAQYTNIAYAIQGWAKYNTEFADYYYEENKTLSMIAETDLSGITSYTELFTGTADTELKKALQFALYNDIEYINTYRLYYNDTLKDTITITTNPEAESVGAVIAENYSYQVTGLSISTLSNSVFTLKTPNEEEVLAVNSTDATLSSAQDVYKTHTREVTAPLAVRLPYTAEVRTYEYVVGGSTITITTSAETVGIYSQFGSIENSNPLTLLGHIIENKIYYINGYIEILSTNDPDKPIHTVTIENLGIFTTGENLLGATDILTTITGPQPEGYYTHSTGNGTAYYDASGFLYEIINNGTANITLMFSGSITVNYSFVGLENNEQFFKTYTGIQAPTKEIVEGDLKSAVNHESLTGHTFTTSENAYNIFSTHAWVTAIIREGLSSQSSTMFIELGTTSVFSDWTLLSLTGFEITGYQKAGTADIKTEITLDSIVPVTYEAVLSLATPTLSATTTITQKALYNGNSVILPTDNTNFENIVGNFNSTNITYTYRWDGVAPTNLVGEQTGSYTLEVTATRNAKSESKVATMTVQVVIEKSDLAITSFENPTVSYNALDQKESFEVFYTINGGVESSLQIGEGLGEVFNVKAHKNNTETATMKDAGSYTIEITHNSNIFNIASIEGLTENVEAGVTTYSFEATIAQAELSLGYSEVHKATKVYDGNNEFSIPLDEITGIQGSDVVTITAIFNSKDVEVADSITVSITDTNYTLTATTYPATITPKALTLTGPVSKVYNGTVAHTGKIIDIDEVTYTIDFENLEISKHEITDGNITIPVGAYLNDTASDWTVSLADIKAKAESDGLGWEDTGTHIIIFVPVDISTLAITDTNYTISAEMGLKGYIYANEGVAVITVSAVEGEYIYGSITADNIDTLFNISLTINGVLTTIGNDITFTYSGASYSTAGKLKAGVHSVIITAQSYVYPGANGTSTCSVTINQKEITLTGIITREYDKTEDITISTDNITGVITGDIISISGKYNSKDVVDATSLSDLAVSGVDGLNYFVISTYADATITPNTTETITLILSETAFVYGELTESNYQAEIEALLTASVNGEGKEALDYTIAIDGGFSTGRICNVGERMVTVNLTSNSNYINGNPLSLQIRIDAKAVTLIAIGENTEIQKVYDGTTSLNASSVTLSGVLTDDVVGFDSQEFAASYVGTHAITANLTGVDSLNYSYTAPTGTINALSVTITRTYIDIDNPFVDGQEMLGDEKTFDVNESTNILNSIDEGMKVKTGYTFGGWYNGESRTEAERLTSDNALTWLLGGGRAVYAKYTINTYKLTIKQNYANSDVKFTPNHMYYEIVNGENTAGPSEDNWNRDAAGCVHTYNYYDALTITPKTSNWYEAYKIMSIGELSSPYTIAHLDNNITITIYYRDVAQTLEINAFVVGDAESDEAENIENIIGWQKNGAGYLTKIFNASEGPIVNVADGTEVAIIDLLPTDGITIQGFTFGGWYLAEGVELGTTKVSELTGTRHQIYAKMDAVEYNVTFNANFEGNTQDPTTQAIAYKKSANLTANAFTRGGYAFTGWNTVADGTGVSYGDGASYTMESISGETLYAQWEINEFTLTIETAHINTVVVSAVGGEELAKNIDETYTLTYGTSYTVTVIVDAGYEIKETATVTPWVITNAMSLLADENGNVATTRTISGDMTGVATLTITATPRLNLFTIMKNDIESISVSVDGVGLNQENVSADVDGNFTFSALTDTEVIVTVALMAGYEFNGNTVITESGSATRIDQAVTITGFVEDLTVNIPTKASKYVIAGGIVIAEKDISKRLTVNVSGEGTEKVNTEYRITTGGSLIITVGNIPTGYDMAIAEIVAFGEFEIPTLENASSEVNDSRESIITISGFTNGNFGIQISLQEKDYTLSINHKIKDKSGADIIDENVAINTSATLKDSIDLITSVTFGQTMNLATSKSGDNAVHYAFKGWYIQSTTTTFGTVLADTNPADILVNPNVVAGVAEGVLTITAIYEYQEYDVTVESGEHGKISYIISKNGTDRVSGIIEAGSSTILKTTYGEIITLTATKDKGYEFASWDGAPAENQTSATFSPETTGNASYKANFIAGTGTLVIRGDLYLNGVQETNLEGLNFVTFNVGTWDAVNKTFVIGTEAATIENLGNGSARISYKTGTDFQVQIAIAQGYTLKTEFARLIPTGVDVTTISGSTPERWTTYQSGPCYIYRFSGYNSEDSAVLNEDTHVVEINATVNNVTVGFKDASGAPRNLAGKIFINPIASGIRVINNGQSTVTIAAISNREIEINASIVIGFSAGTNANGKMVEIKGTTLDESGNTIQVAGGVLEGENLIAEDSATTGFAYTVKVRAKVDANAVISIIVEPEEYDLALYDTATGVNEYIGTVSGVKIGSVINVSEELRNTISSLERSGHYLNGFFQLNNGQGTRYINGNGYATENVWSDNGYSFNGTTYEKNTNYTVATAVKNGTFKLYADWGMNKTSITIDTIPQAIKELVEENNTNSAVTKVSMFKSLNNSNSWKDESNVFYADLLWGADLRVEAPIYDGYEFKYWEVILDGEIQSERVESRILSKSGGYENRNVGLTAVYYAEVAVSSTLGGDIVLVRDTRDESDANVIINNTERKFISPNRSFYLVAKPQSGFTFTGWKINGELDEEKIIPVVGEDNLYVYTASTISEFGPMAIEATFTGNPVTIETRPGILANGGEIKKITHNNVTVWETATANDFIANIGDTILMEVALGESYGVKWNMKEVQYYGISQEDGIAVYTYSYVLSADDVVEDKIVIEPVFSLDRVVLDVYLAMDGSAFTLTNRITEGTISGVTNLAFGEDGIFTITPIRNYTVKSITIEYSEEGVQSTPVSITRSYSRDTNILKIDSWRMSNASDSHIGNLKYKVKVTFKKDLWQENISVSQLTGSGTVNNPYQITTAEELAFVANKVNSGDANYSTAHYIVKNDINLADKFWAPIGTEENKFNGTFDFSGYNIYGATVDPSYSSQETTYNGVFGVLGTEATFVEQNNTLAIVLGSVFGLLGVVGGTILIVFLVRRKKKRDLERLANS